MAPKAAMALALDKLKSSGLTRAHMEKLKMEVLDPGEVIALHSSFAAVPALRLNYVDPSGDGFLTSWPSGPPFYRLRYLARLNDFSKATGKDTRYAQPPDSGVCAYFPSVVDWSEVVVDPSRPIVITEGEFKAAKASVDGFPTIGLGGVYNFKSSRRGIPFLNELDAINWAKRRVFIAYDSDLKSNAQVCQALNDLADELLHRGAFTHYVMLPDVVENGKTGLDDFLVARGAIEFGKLLEEAEPITLARPLWTLNDRVVYVRNPGLIVDQLTGQKMSPAAFREHAHATEVYHERIVKPAGVTLKRVSASAAWLKWPMRREAASLTYAPGEGRFTKRGEYNTWPGWGAEPKKGDVEPFTRLVDHLFANAEHDAKRWFLKWAAYPLQYPGTKLFSSVVFHGIKHGTGKSLIGYSLGRIYGKNFTEINQTHLHSSFNEWAENKQFVLGDDVTGSNKRQDADMLKKLITQKEMRMNVKYVPSYVVPDCVNYFFTSNHPDAFFLEDDDRRFFIHEILVDPLPEDFYAEYDLWLNSSYGVGALFAYLLSIDVSDFNPNAPAFKTVARQRMIADVKSDLGSWVAKLIDDPDSILRTPNGIPSPFDLFSNDELLKIYDPTGKTKVTANGLGRELRRAGVPLVCDGKPVRTFRGQDRFYIIRNREQWIKARPIQIAKHIDAIDDFASKNKKRH